MTKLKMAYKGIYVILLAMLISACSGSVPGDVLEQAVLTLSQKPYPGYVMDNWEVTNEYMQDDDGEETTVIEYSITYFLEEKEIQKLKKSGYTNYVGKRFDAPLIIEGRLFFAKRGSKWYSGHQKL